VIGSLGKRLAAVTLGVGAACVLLEVLVRLVAGAASPPPRVVGIREPHGSGFTEPHQRYEPGPRFNKPKFKILVVGDSFTWGDGVYHYDIWAKRLEVLLERLDRNLDVEIDLVSRPGWNTYREVRAVRERIDKIAPDLVILGYCLNDAEPVVHEHFSDLRPPLERRSPTLRASRFLHRHSRIYRLLWERLENTRQRRAYNFYYHELYRRSGWRSTRVSLEELRQLAADRQARLVVAVFPIFDQQLDAGYSHRDLHATVMDELERLEIPALDLLPAYEGIDAVRLAVNPFVDGHPGELAHRIASQALTGYLVSNGFVPIDPRRLKAIELSLPPGG